MLILLTFATLSAPTEQRTKIFVGIDGEHAAELAPRQQRELRDSAEDIRRHLRKRFTLEVVERPDDAEIRLLVTARRVEVGVSGETNYGAGHTQRQYQSRHVIEYHLHSDGIRHEAEAALAGSFVTWKRVAGAVVDDVEIWVSELRERL
jgi:hypothetical protein